MAWNKTFVVEPGSKLHLDRVDPADTGKYGDEGAARERIAKDLERLEKLQYRLYAENRRAVLIVLQALDAGGKDGTVRHVFSGMNPEGIGVQPFKVPTADEAAHDFLWRIHKATPARGHITIFNRSHYEDLLVPLVHQTIPKDAIEKRYARIDDFEKNLSQAGTRILKFFLHISKAEQLRRFAARLEDPRRQWKISESDYTDRERWDDYQTAYEDVLERTSTERAPWYVIPSDHKWFRNLAVARIVADALDDLHLKTPEPSVDIADIRRRFHAAAGTDPAPASKPA